LTEISWEIGRRESEIILEIVSRAVGLAESANLLRDLPPGARASFRAELGMDLTATHANGCPLRLEELLAAPPADFAHDVFGIREHIDRDTGTLRDCFLPRYARRTE
jgi:hypothetical protein